jgi:hypothetical protein
MTVHRDVDPYGGKLIVGVLSFGGFWFYCACAVLLRINYFVASFVSL